MPLKNYVGAVSEYVQLGGHLGEDKDTLESPHLSVGTGMP